MSWGDCQSQAFILLFYVNLAQFIWTIWFEYIAVLQPHISISRNLPSLNQTCLSGQINLQETEKDLKIKNNAICTADGKQKSE